mgnify:CR=1 FL=1
MLAAVVDAADDVAVAMCERPFDCIRVPQARSVEEGGGRGPEAMRGQLLLRIAHAPERCIERVLAHRADAAAGRGKDVAFGAQHLFGQFRCRSRLAPQIELGIGPALEIGDGEARTQSRELPAHRLDMGRGPFIGGDVAGELLADTRAQHLDCDLAAVGGGGAVDLRDRRGADRHTEPLAEPAVSDAPQEIGDPYAD